VDVIDPISLESTAVEEELPPTFWHQEDVSGSSAPQENEGGPICPPSLTREFGDTIRNCSEL